MSLRVEDRLFTDLTPEEAQELRAGVDDMVLRGSIPATLYPFVDAWCEATNNRHDLLVIGTSFTIWAMYSLLRRTEEQLHDDSPTDPDLEGPIPSHPSTTKL